MQKIKLLQRALFIMLLLIIMKNTHAQTGLNFQGVARNSNNVILASQAITIKLSILQGSATGAADYVETRKVNTNAQGLFTAVIGDTGAISAVGNFATINWKNTPKFLKIEMDPLAGTNFITMGTTQFQYVAYAQFASSVDAENISGIVPVARGGTGTNSLNSLKTALALDKSSVGLSNVDNTTDALKPISTATQTALDLKANTALTVPYTGATGPVNLGAYDLQVNGLVVGKGGGGNRYSTVLGLDALTNNTTGQGNTAVGNRVLKSNTIGESNTAVGYSAMFKNTAGNYNTALGDRTLVLNETGNENTAAGAGALNANTTGSANTAMGTGSLASNTTAKNNTAVGVNASNVNATSENNTAVGANSLTLSTGEKNTAIGSRALDNNRTGAGNTAIGYLALTENISGNNNTAIGSNTHTSADFNNSTAIGNGATINASNTIQLGNAYITDVITSGAVTAAAFSGTWSGTAIDVAHGGTGATTKNFVDLTSNQNIAGEKNFNSDVIINGIQLGRGTGTTNSNTLLGTNSLVQNTTGAYNVAIGSYVLNGNTTGESNVAIGASSLYKNTTGLRNIGIGLYNLLNNTSGGDNIGIGSSALFSNSTGNNNIAIGGNALKLSTLALRNISIGLNSMFNNTTGNDNIAIGNEALWANTISNYNVAVGYMSQRRNTTGQNNAAYGKSSMYSNINGNNNTAIGTNSLFLNIDGSNNTALGFASLRGNLGNDNTAIGVSAGASNESGSNNIFIGNLSDAGANNLVNSIAIGNEAVVNASNTIQLGNTNITDVITSGAITAAAYNGNWNGTTIDIAHGGTGSITKNFVDITTDQTIAGIKSFSADAIVNGLTIGKGTGGDINSTVLGYNALVYNTSGRFNTALGMSVLANNTTGENNTATGWKALANNTIGWDNTATGYASLFSNNGDRNTAYGNYSLYVNSSGTDNTAIGNSSLAGNTVGTDNTAIGSGADVGANNLSNATAIGAGAVVNTPNTIQLGNTSVTSVVTSGTISATGFATTTGTSSQFLKANGTVDGNTYVNSADTKIKIGEAAGGINQGLNAIGVGLYAGSTNQGDLSVAIGSQAGYINQGYNSVALGLTAGSFSQATNAVAIGNRAGNDLQGTKSIAIGMNAGNSRQGDNSIAIGTSAGLTSQAANSVILNASGVTLDASTNGFFVAPVRSATTTDNLYYNATTKEITYGSGGTVTADAGGLTGTTLKSTVTASSLTSVGTLANLSVTNPIVGSLAGNANTATTATTAGNITATSNTTLTSLSNLATVGTITSGTWSASTIAVNKGGTGSTSLAANSLLVGNGANAVQTIAPATNGNILYADGTNWISKTLTVGISGSTLPISIRDPYLVLNYCIATQGVFPTRSGYDVYLGEINIFPYNFVPQGYLACNGALLSIASNSALYSLLGTYYGGNGVNNFALPDLRGKTIVGQGQGVGLTNMNLAEQGGTETITITSSQMPAHSHTIIYN